MRILTGGILHPLAAYLLHRSLPTLPFRVREAQERARALALLLGEHPAVARVLYPEADGVPAPRTRGRARVRGRGGAHPAAAAVMGAVRLITPAVSLGAATRSSSTRRGSRTASSTRRRVRRAGITDGLLRLAVGLEDVHDLWLDLEQALAAADGLATAGSALAAHA